MTKNFYLAFEDRYRGSRELVKSRLTIYLPFISPLPALYPSGKAIDLGCGRGEWLELLKEAGIEGHGVDLDDDVLVLCRERGLNVATADAIASLRSLPDESQLIVSGFHIAEHLPFSDLQSLVAEALRVLKPAGVLILETPNPENIVVGACNFYLDPTHQRPIPHQLMSFLAEYYGFSRTKVLGLQESQDLVEGRELRLRDVLGGASPDYAVVAQKRADANVLAATSQAFDIQYGVSMETLADRYDRQLKAAVEGVASRVRQAEEKAEQAVAQAAQAEAKARQAEERAFLTRAQALLQKVRRKF